MTLKNFLKQLKTSEQTVSMLLGAFVVVVIGIFIFNYFQSGVRQQAASTENQEVTVTTPTPKVEIVTGLQVEKQTEPGSTKTHKVSKTERLWDISLLYYGSGYNWVDIARANKLSNPDKLLVGQELTIPEVTVRKPLADSQTIQPQIKPISEEKYTIVKGDSLWKIAVRAYGDGYKWVQVAKANKITNPNIIHSGNVISIPR